MKAAILVALALSARSETLRLFDGPDALAESNAIERPLPAVSPVRTVSSLTPWKLSLSALALAETADAISSRGLVEANPLLQTGPQGVFSGTKGTGLKAATVAGIAVAEWLIVRHHPGRARAFVWLNYSLAGATAGVAARNWSLKQ